MLNKAQNKLKAAGSAFENEFFDDAASCSYYAAYHAVCALLASHGLAFSSHGQTKDQTPRSRRLPRHLPRQSHAKAGRPCDGG
jgi:HEPN domain-containing protein